MGKIVDELGSEQRGFDGSSGSSNGSSSDSRNLLCNGLIRFAHHCNLKCVLVLVLSLLIFLPALFLLIPSHHNNHGFDAASDVKAQAAVEAYFRLEKPVLQLIPHIEQLEDELSGEVGVPFTKISVLSMRQAGAPNLTDVIFGVLPDPINTPINPVSLSLLKTSLIDLFLLRSNLTFLSSIFGQSSSFQILKVAGGITVIPEPVTIWEMPQMLFNFTLSNSILDINENLAELEQQLKGGLHLRSFEYTFVQVTNFVGSTTSPPVTIQASVYSDLGRLVPSRLKQLAEIIQNSSPSRNLGLNDSVFGKVNSVILSTYLENTIHAASPSPSPAPSPNPSFSHSPSPSSDCKHNSPSKKGSPCSPSSKPKGSPRRSPRPHVHRDLPSAPSFSPNPSTQPSSSSSQFRPYIGIWLLVCIAVIFHFM
ncbi:hypothetical protein Droror1_Dr00021810 [Drosera rotundifolia]